VVLDVKGSFREHIVMLNKLEGVSGTEVRTREQLHSVDGLIIPGGALTLIPRQNLAAWMCTP
jgi:5'-phosphate synthase pdxT subunit